MIFLRRQLKRQGGWRRGGRRRLQTTASLLCWFHDWSNKRAVLQEQFLELLMSLKKRGRHFSKAAVVVLWHVTVCHHNRCRTPNPDLIFMEKPKRVNHSSLIFMAIYPKNVYSKTRRYCWDECVCEGGKDCRFCIWHLSKPRRKWREPFRKFQLNGGFWNGIIYLLCFFFFFQK